MKNILPITMADYAGLLQKKCSAVPWNPTDMAKPLEDFQAFSARLDATDAERV